MGWVFGTRQGYWCVIMYMIFNSRYIPVIFDSEIHIFMLGPKVGKVGDTYVDNMTLMHISNQNIVLGGEGRKKIKVIQQIEKLPSILKASYFAQ